MWLSYVIEKKNRRSKQGSRQLVFFFSLDQVFSVVRIPDFLDSLYIPRKNEEMREIMGHVVNDMNSCIEAGVLWFIVQARWSLVLCVERGRGGNRLLSCFGWCACFTGTRCDAIIPPFVNVWKSCRHSASSNRRFPMLCWWTPKTVLWNIQVSHVILKSDGLSCRQQASCLAACYFGLWWTR